MEVSSELFSAMHSCKCTERGQTVTPPPSRRVSPQHPSSRGSAAACPKFTSYLTPPPPHENNFKNQNIFLMSGDFAEQGEVFKKKLHFYSSSVRNSLISPKLTSGQIKKG